MDNNTKSVDEQVTQKPGALLIFVLGAPCSGKSTLCKALSDRWDLDHFSLGTELRWLVSNNPIGHAARIKPFFTTDELSIFTSNVYAGTLGPSTQTPKYVKERVFPTDVDPSAIRILIDGFPRSLDRWLVFKDTVKDKWVPDQRTLVIFLSADEELALERFVKRGRAGDEFKRRFKEFESTRGEIVDGMTEDNGLVMLDVKVKEGMVVEEIVKVVEDTAFWKENVGE